MTHSTRFSVAALVMLFAASALWAEPAPAVEAAHVSKLTGTSFGASPDRDGRPEAIAQGSEFLGQLAKQGDPAAGVSDVEILFWRGAIKPAAVEAYEKMVTDNLAKGGYVYKAGDAAGGVTRFTAESKQQGRIIGYWQTSAAGLSLGWGRVSGAGAAVAAPPVVPAPAAVADPAPVKGDKDAEIAELKRRLAEAEAAKTTPAVPAAPAATGGVVIAQAPANIAAHPIEESELVIKAADGTPVIANKNGSSLDGLKLSTHDLAMGSPSMVVAPDGTIHIAFNEAHKTTFEHAIYHRSSADGGKTWSEAKNLSEELPGPGFDVGHCQVLADSKSRVYVIWRAGLRENWTVGIDPVGGISNLWFRELEGGKWSKAKVINEAVKAEAPNDAPRSFFAAVDGAGRAQVIWNVQPDKWHPEVMTNKTHTAGVGNGLVFQSTLDGAVAGAPKEIFLPAIGTVGKGAWATPSCDDLDTLNGYFDSAGAAHFVAAVTGTMYGAKPHEPDYELMEGGKVAQVIKLPAMSFHAWKDVPTLLVDAKGKRHLITLYMAGEHPNVRDYLLGGEDEPAVIRSPSGLNGTIGGMQACQGPGGRMVVIMQINDTGVRSAEDNFISMSSGDGKWSVPVNVTNNVGRKTYVSKDTSTQSAVSQETGCEPGPGVVAFDKEGHLLLLSIKQEYGIVHSTAFGVTIAGGGSKTPTLRFLRF